MTAAKIIRDAAEREEAIGARKAEALFGREGSGLDCYDHEQNEHAANVLRALLPAIEAATQTSERPSVHVEGNGCTFCGAHGGKLAANYDANLDGYYIGCVKCGATGPQYDAQTVEQALALWNDGAVPSPSLPRSVAMRIAEAAIEHTKERAEVGETYYGHPAVEFRAVDPAAIVDRHLPASDIERAASLPVIVRCADCAHCHQVSSRHDRGGETVCARANDRNTDHRTEPPAWCPLRARAKASAESEGEE